MKKKKIYIAMAVMYFVAAIINLLTGIVSPSIYKAWSDTALLPIYKIIMDSFTPQILAIVMAIVCIYQIIMAYCFFVGTDKLIKIGLIMSILFHLIIIPWGLWSLPNIAFVILSLALLYKECSN